MLFPVLALLCPVLVAAHGQVSWVQIGTGPQYPAWTLDDYYIALYRESGQLLSHPAISFSTH